MTQIILENISLPEASFDRYACWEDDIKVEIEMIWPRIVSEVRGRVWKVRWAYDYLDNQFTRKLLAILRSGKHIQAAVLPDNSDKMVSSLFIVTSLTQPNYLCSDNEEPIWHGLGFTLREVNPHA